MTWAARWGSMGLVGRLVLTLVMVLPLVVAISAIWPGDPPTSASFVLPTVIPFALTLWLDRRFLRMRHRRRLLCWQVERTGLPVPDDEVNRVAVQRLQRMADWQAPKVVSIAVGAIAVATIVAMCVVAADRAGAVYLLCAVPILVAAGVDVRTPTPEPPRTRLYRLQDARSAGDRPVGRDAG